MAVINPIVVQSGGGGGGFEFFGNLTIVMYQDSSSFPGVDKIQYSFDGGTTWLSPTEGPVGVETEKVFQTKLIGSNVMIRSTDNDTVDCVWSVTCVYTGIEAGQEPNIQSHGNSGAGTTTVGGWYYDEDYGDTSQYSVVVFFGHTEHN